MNFEELKIQIAVGTLPKTPSVLARMVRDTDCPELIQWGLAHGNANVVAAAIGNLHCPVYDFIRIAVLDRRVAIQEVIDQRIKFPEKVKLINDFIDLTKEVEAVRAQQLELDFDASET